MNKSKFLKRSLATLLAILMVVAMVPMSAFAAAGDPDVIKVGGEEAVLSGDAYTVSMSVPSGTSGVVENALRNVQFELRTENGTTVGIINKDGAQNTTSLKGQPGTASTRQNVDLLSYANKPEGTYWGDYTGIKLKVTANDGTAVTYPLTITVSERNASSDTTIASVESTRIVGAEVDNTAKTIVITKPVGRDDYAKTLGLNPNGENFKLSSPNATINVGVTTANWGTTAIDKVTVTAEDGSTQVYSVSYVVEKIFDEFSVPDMISYEEKENGDTGNVNITVKVPFGTFGDSSHIIPTFTPSSDVKHIDSKTSFTNDGGVYDRDNEQTTSGVADWSAATSATDPDNGDKKVSFTFTVETNRSTLAVDAVGKGDVVITFVPVANPASKLTGVNVGIENGADGYSQGLIEVADNGRSPTIIVGDIPNDNLKDVDDATAGTKVVELTKRDIILHVSKNAKVTVMNPWDGSDSKVYDDAKESAPATAHDGLVTLDDVNLRKYHSTPMHLLVEAEDGAYNHATNYYLTFNGPDGKPVIQSVTLIDETTGKEYTVSPNKDGEATFKLPEIPADLSGYLVRVKASDGASVHDYNTPSNVHQTAIVITGNEEGVDADSRLSNLASLGAGTSKIKLHTYFDGTNHAQADDDDGCGVYVFTIEEADKSEEGVITSLTLTGSRTLLASSTDKFPATINQDKKTIRVEVPFDYVANSATNNSAGNIYVLDWTVSDGAVVRTAFSGDNDINKFDVADLSEQKNRNVGTVRVGELTDTKITTVAGEASYDVTNGLPVKVYSEAIKKADGTAISEDPTTTYYLYAVRQNASGESKLNNVTATAPVSVALDTKVAKLNRYIITVPKNYNSTTGISNAKEFELTFDRSAKSTVVNGQRTWCGKDDTSAKFKVADSKLYFNNEQVTLTDGRIIHFTVVAENGTSTGEYEFVVVEGEASKDATLKSVKVDENVSFEQDGESFIVKDLSEDENYDVKKLPVIIETNDPGATVTVDGKAYSYNPADGSNITVDLSEGKTAEVVVTAADEVTTATYTLSMRDGSAPVDRPSDSYTDLDKVYSGHLERVKYAIDNGLMSNDGKPGVFNSEGKIARRDFALIIARANMRLANPDAEDIDALLKGKYAGKEDAFNDIAKLNDTQKAAIAYCKEIGIVEGNGQNGFNPSGAVSREDAAIMIAKWCELEAADNGNTNNIKDWTNVHNWAKAYVNAVYEAKLMNGTGNDNFTPARNLNRGEAAYIIVGALETKAPSAD